MITVTWYDPQFIGSKAVRSNDTITIYDANNHEIQKIFALGAREWQNVSIDGEWSYPEDIPTEEEVLRADIDFLTMENEYLEAENSELKDQQEIDRADIDFCLMLLEE